jgi:tetratricopeptide (TPR) repeat protein
MRKLSRAFLIVLSMLFLTVRHGTGADDRIICDQSRGDLSISACTRLIESGQLNTVGLAQAYSDRGLTYFRNSQFDLAITDYSEAMRHIPPNTYLAASANLFAMRGWAYLSKQNFQGAVADFEAAVRLNPNTPGAMQGLENARQALANSTNNADVPICANKSGDQSIEACTRLIQSGRFDGNRLAYAFAYRAWAYRSIRKYDESISDINEVMKLAPDKPTMTSSYVLRGDIHFQEGELDAALSDYRAALALTPNEHDALNGIGRIEKARAEIAPRPSPTPIAPPSSTTVPPPTPTVPVTSENWPHPNSNVALIVGVILWGFISRVASSTAKRIPGVKERMWREIVVETFSGLFTDCMLYGLGIVTDIKFLAVPLIGGVSLGLFFSPKAS